MKKKTTANLMMVLVIVAFAIGGGLLAFSLKENGDNGLGSQYQIKTLENQTLLEDGQENRCTMTIVCDTILENLDSLDEEKIPYVPQNGVILPETTVSFSAGDTAFTVLQKVCTAAEIQLEYGWTPLYDSYYIEGINHLYEFDCGVESGWMYQVNDWFPNYGCSAYELNDGDDIVWCFTCVGLGTDVGKTRMGEQ